MHINNKNNDPLDPKLWEEYLASFSKRCKSDAQKQAKIWDKAAKDYDGLELSGSYNFQVEEILKELQEAGALKSKYRVIDVACGTGIYALRMSPFVDEIDCIDVSKMMLQRLKEKAQVLGINNINTILADWFHFNPSKKYELVFASMTPILRGKESLDKLLDISKRFLAIVFWAGVRQNILLSHLYQHILGEKYNKKSLDIVPIFNYYCSLGYRPRLRFFRGCWIREKDIEEAFEALRWRLEFRRPLKKEELKILKDEIEKAVTNNKIILKTRVRIGFILLDKKLEKDLI